MLKIRTRLEVGTTYACSDIGTEDNEAKLSIQNPTFMNTHIKGLATKSCVESTGKRVI